MFFTNDFNKIEINSLDDLLLDLEEFKKIREKNLLDLKIQKVQENILNKINKKVCNKIDLIFSESNTRELAELISDDYNELTNRKEEIVFEQEDSSEEMESGSDDKDCFVKTNEKKDVKTVTCVEEECFKSEECEINLNEFKKEKNLFSKENKKR